MIRNFKFYSPKKTENKKLNISGQLQEPPKCYGVIRDTDWGRRGKAGGFQIDAFGLVWELTEQTGARVASPYWHQRFCAG